VTRGLWRTVGEVLKRGVRDTQRKWAVEEASKRLTESDSADVLAQHCSDDQRDSVLTTLVTRGLWEAVGDVLKRGVSDTQREWAVDEASKTADDDDDDHFSYFILKHCSDDQLECVLTTLVTRGI
jgi:Arc/MetJ-type ribon-helix-helix transcriptional regulator